MRVLRSIAPQGPTTGNRLILPYLLIPIVRKYIITFMKTLTSTVSQKGQTTIPQTVREKLGVKEGDILEYEVEGAAVRIRKMEKIDTEWARALESTLTEWTGESDDDL